MAKRAKVYKTMKYHLEVDCRTKEERENYLTKKIMEDLKGVKPQKLTFSHNAWGSIGNVRIEI